MIRNTLANGYIQFVESRDIIWLGLKVVVEQSFGYINAFERRYCISEILPRAGHHPQAVFVSVENKNNTLAKVLKYLSKDRWYSTRVIILLEKPYASEIISLLYAFGVDDVLYYSTVDGVCSAQLVKYPNAFDGKLILSARERLVISRLILGERVVDISHGINRDVRTVSHQKIMALKKIGVSSCQLKIMGAQML